MWTDLSSFSFWIIAPCVTTDAVGTDQVTLFEETYLLWDIILLLSILVLSLILYKKKEETWLYLFQRKSSVTEKVKFMLRMMGTI